MARDTAMREQARFLFIAILTQFLALTLTLPVTIQKQASGEYTYKDKG